MRVAMMLIYEISVYQIKKIFLRFLLIGLFFSFGCKKKNERDPQEVFQNNLKCGSLREKITKYLKEQDRVFDANYFERNYKRLQMTEETHTLDEIWFSPISNSCFFSYYYKADTYMINGDLNKLRVYFIEDYLRSRKIWSTSEGLIEGQAWMLLLQKLSSEDELKKFLTKKCEIYNFDKKRDCSCYVRLVVPRILFKEESSLSSFDLDSEKCGVSGLFGK